MHADTVLLIKFKILTIRVNPRPIKIHCFFKTILSISRALPILTASAITAGVIAPLLAMDQKVTLPKDVFAGLSVKGASTPLLLTTL